MRNVKTKVEREVCWFDGLAVSAELQKQFGFDPNKLQCFAQIDLPRLASYYFDFSYLFTGCASI
jgi:hypothetical protein